MTLSWDTAYRSFGEKWTLGHPHDTLPVPFAVTNFRA
jgi:hypothetical protein